jgi:hypothetical protein
MTLFWPSVFITWNLKIATTRVRLVFVLLSTLNRLDRLYNTIRFFPDHRHRPHPNMHFIEFWSSKGSFCRNSIKSFGLWTAVVLLFTESKSVLIQRLHNISQSVTVMSAMSLSSQQGLCRKLRISGTRQDGGPASRRNGCCSNSEAMARCIGSRTNMRSMKPCSRGDTCRQKISSINYFVNVKV